jgi:hypothetical protein
VVEVNMKHRATVLALAGLAALRLAGPAAPATGVADDIRRTTEALLQGEGPGDVHATLRHLLEIAADLGREARLAAPAQAKLDAAAAEARRLSPLDAAVRAKAAEAYAALDPGRAFAFPKEVGSIEQAKAYGRGQVDRCLAAFSAGRTREAAREIMGLVLLVITPMEKPQ